MGREIKRVPLDFAHPLRERWPGYVSPTPRPCPAGAACHDGLTPARKWFHHAVSLILLAAEDPARRDRQMHPMLADVSTIRLSDDIVELTTGLAGRAPRWGHDAIDRWSAVNKIISAAGLDPETWGLCPACGGLNHHPDDEAMLEAWAPTEPPEGDGWQLWETVSEGSPVGPVLPTREAFIDWLVTDQGHSPDVAARFTETGWAPTARAGADGVLRRGIDAA